MKIILAPDSFKDCLTAAQVASAMECGIRKVAQSSEIMKIPLADGGEGTLESMVSATGGQILLRQVTGPLGKPVNARYGILGDGKTAVIEMASASGLMLVPEKKRNPVLTTSYGTGELIRTAMDQGVRTIIVCIGGSSTTDCGTGMMQALGAAFVRKNGMEITEPLCGLLMADVKRIYVSKLHPALASTRILIACDVENTLLGKNGAVMTYSRQKGAKDRQLIFLEKAMSHIATVMETATGKTIRNDPGTGAAGGLAVPLIAFANARLQSGARLVLETLHFADRIRGASIVFTGEGTIDHQTAFGKTVRAVAVEAKKQGIPVIVIAGAIERGAEELYSYGVTSLFSVCDKPMTLKQSLQKASYLISEAAEHIMRLFMSR